jgi:DNA repair protein RadC
MTREMATAAKALGLALHDHVIVGNGKWVSFRQEGLL